MKAYTIITRDQTGKRSRTVGDFDSDEAALRWVYYYLGLDRAASAALYRGCDELPDVPLATVTAPL